MPMSSPGGGFTPSEDSALTYQAPADWVAEDPSSRMRRAQYRLPKAAGDPEDAELVVFFFPGQGGSVNANVDRWIGMFTRGDGSAASSDAKIDKRQINGQTITVVDVSGVYTNTMAPMGGASPKPDYRMLAAIVETPGGPWFFKLTGPAKTVGKWEPSFNSFLGTIRGGKA